MIHNPGAMTNKRSATTKPVIWLIILIPLFLNSCFIVEIQKKDRNPRKAGSYEKFDQETILLGNPSHIRCSFDVTFYDLDIEISPREKELSGWVEIRAKALSDIDSVQLDLDDVLSIDELRWEKRDGISLEYNRSSRAIFIKLPARIIKDQTFSIHVKYSGKPVIAKKPPWKGGMVWKKDRFRKDWIGVACESEGASIWFPCKDMTSDEPDSARLCFTIPDTSLMVVSNGNLKEVKTTGNGKTFCWGVSYPINMYNITFYVGDFVKIEDTYYGADSNKLDLTYYVMRSNENKARKHFTQTKDILQAYEQIFGPYPWYRDGYKLVESPFAGMEHQSAIAYGSDFKNEYYFDNDYIIVHETAHEWFGNAVSAADFADIWLQEGFATYAEVLFYERKLGKPDAQAYIQFQRMFIENKFPLIGPSNLHYFNVKKSADAYNKGAWVLHSFRTILADDSLFYSIIRTFYIENRYKTVTTDDFINTVNRITGKDYRWFFNTYLYQNKIPVLEIDADLKGNFYYRWAEVPEDFDKIILGGYFDHPIGKKEFTITPTTKVQYFEMINIMTKEDMTLTMNISSPLGYLVSPPYFYSRNMLLILKNNGKLHNLFKSQPK